MTQTQRKKEQCQVMPQHVTQDAFWKGFDHFRAILRPEAQLAGEIYEGRLRGTEMTKALQNEVVRECLTCFSWNRHFQLYLLEELASAGELVDNSMKALVRRLQSKKLLSQATASRIEGTLGL